MPARGRTPLLFLAEYESVLWIFHIHLFVHSDFNGHSGYFHLLASAKCCYEHVCLLSPRLQFFGVYT